MATKTYNAQTLLVTAKPRNKRLRETGGQGGSSATVDVDLTPYLLKAIFDDMFEKVNIGSEEEPKWSIKAKYGLWTEQFLSAKGVGDGSAEGGIGYEAVQEMIADALAGYTPAATDVNWTDIVCKPDVFAPSAHLHTVADITDLATTLSGYSTTGHKHTKAEITDFAHSHSWDSITDKPTTLSGYGITDAVPNTRKVSAGTGLTGGGTLDADRTISLNETNVGLLQMLADMFEWATVNGVQTIKAKASLWTEGFLSAKGVEGEGSAQEITYEAVQEMIAEALQGFDPGTGTIDWDSIVGKPDVFSPASHTHAWGSITGKPATFAPSAHSHTKSEITDFAHSHSKEDITDFAHDHAIADVTGLQTALDGKVPTSRTITAGTGLTGGGNLTANRTISLNTTNQALLAMLSEMFEWDKSKDTTSGKTDSSKWAIKAKASLWTEGYLSAKGTSSDSSASGLTAEAVQEMIDDALVGYTPGDGIVEWTDIVGKPDTFAPSSHTHSYLPLTGGTLTGSLSVSGNVGIGTTSPAYKLDVNGTISAGAPGEGNELLRFNTDRPWVFVQEGAGASTSLALKTTADGKSFVIRAYGGQQIAKFYSDEDSSTVTLGNNNLYCTYSGNVGIGTTSPAYKLDVNGSIRMSGNLTIGSNSIIGGDGQTILGYKPASGFTGVSNTQWGVGASDSQGVIRSTNTNLIHYRSGASSPSSVILDSANYTDYAVPNTRTITAGTGLAGGGTLAADRTISLNATNVGLLQMLADMFEWATVAGVQTIKAKASLWTEGFLSAKGVGDGSAEGGVGYEAVQEMIADALAGYTPAATDVNWTDIVGKPDTFAPSAHQHTVADITDLATTLSGYSTTGHEHTKAEITDFAHTHSWNDITSDKPTTLGGYGITDAVPNTRKVSAGTGLTGGGALSADRTISLNATNVGLLQMLSDMFEWQTVGGVRTIKAKASLWTDGYLSAKGTDGDVSGDSAIDDLNADILDIRAQLQQDKAQWQSAVSNANANIVQVSGALGTLNTTVNAIPRVSVDVNGKLTIDGENKTLDYGSLRNRPTIPSVSLANGTISIDGATIKPLTSHQSLSGYATQSWANSRFSRGWSKDSNGSLYRVERTGGAEDTSWHKIATFSHPSTSTKVYSACTIAGTIWYELGNHLQSRRKEIKFDVSLYAFQNSTTAKNTEIFELSANCTYDIIRLVKNSTNVWELQVRQHDSYTYLTIEYTANNYNNAGTLQAGLWAAGTAPTNANCVVGAYDNCTRENEAMDWNSVKNKSGKTFKVGGVTYDPFGSENKELAVGVDTSTGKFTIGDTTFTPYSSKNKPTAADVGARASDWMPTASEVGARPSTWTPTAADVGVSIDNNGKITVGTKSLTPVTSLSGYATEDFVTGKGYATQTWVNNKGYLTSHQSLADYAKTSDVNSAISSATGSLLSLGDITINGGTITITKGDSSKSLTAITSHQDLSNYATKTALNNALQIGNGSNGGKLATLKIQLNGSDVDTYSPLATSTKTINVAGVLTTGNYTDYALSKVRLTRTGSAQTIDMNSVADNAWTIFDGDKTANETFLNLPNDAGVDGGMAILNVRHGYYRHQLLFPYSTTGRPYTRCQHYNQGAVWAGWQKFAFVSDLGNYLPLSGGTLTGALIFDNSANIDFAAENDRPGFWIKRFNTNAGLPQDYTTIVNFGTGTKGSGDMQLGYYVGGGEPKLSVRSLNANDKTWCDWRTLVHSGNYSAYITKSYVDELGVNAATAEKLVTARTIWGQSFNGTANVDGVFRSLTDATSGQVLHSILIYPLSPFGLVTRIYDSGAVSLQSQRETTTSEYFGLSLNPLGGNVGIGTTSPAYKLDVNGGIRSNSTCYISAPSGTDGMIYCQTNGGTQIGFGVGTSTKRGVHDRGLGWVMYTNGTNVLFENGNVGIGTTSPDAKLHVAGAVHATDNITSDKECVSKFTTSSSDERLKRVTGGVDIAMRSIAEAPSIRFDWRDGSGKDAGSIAQYWQDIVPEAVRTDSKGYLTMQYGKLALLSAISLARNAVSHELEIEQLKQRVEQLEREVERLSA